MESILAITGKDFILTAANKAAVRGITVLKTSDNKTRKLNNQNLLLFSGESGDSVSFAEYIRANIQLYEKRNDLVLNSDAVASFVRQELATSLRSKRPYQTNILIAGYDDGPHLYWIDYLASSASLPFAAHGYGQLYIQSLFDRYHRPDISLEEGIHIMKKATAEIEKRLPLNLGGWKFNVVDKDGIRDLEIEQTGSGSHRSVLELSGANQQSSEQPMEMAAQS